MAQAFASGRLHPTSPLVTQVPWPEAAETFALGGFVPSTTRTGAAAPVCAPGFALVLAPFHWLFGDDGIFLVTPIAGALLAGLAYSVARSLGGPAAGAVAAILVATSPIVLFQVVQPMNDIVTAALWMGVLASSTGALTRSRVAVMGLITSGALLVRPNLAPLAVVTVCWVALAHVRRAPDRDGRATSGLTWPSRLLVFCVFAAPGVVLVGALGWALYGSPVATGYGPPGDLFSLQSIPINLANYSRALLETQTPLLLLAPLAPLVCRGRTGAWLALGLLLATLAVYLIYRPFPEWWYLRFLLPAIVAAIALSSAVTATLAARVLGGRAGVLAAAILALGVGVYGLRTAEERRVFQLARLEGRFRHAAMIVRHRLPETTVVFAAWESGSIRYHAGREAVMWGSLDPAWLDRGVQWLVSNGYRPVFLFERWEEPLFRERFGGRSALGGLDWPPRFDVDRQVRIFDPADRAPYFAGAFISTEMVRDR